MFHNGLVSNHFTTAFLIVLAFVISHALPNVYQITRRYTPACDYRYRAENLMNIENGKILWRPTVAWAAFTAVVFAVSILSLSTAKEFVYFQF
jgi:hypothetical protein